MNTYTHTYTHTFFRVIFGYESTKEKEIEREIQTWRVHKIQITYIEKRIIEKKRQKKETKCAAMDDIRLRELENKPMGEKMII